MVTAAFAGLGVKKDVARHPRNALQAFSGIVENNMKINKEVEDQKLKLEHNKFEYQKKLDDEKIMLERDKVRTKTSKH